MHASNKSWTMHVQKYAQLSSRSVSFGLRPKQTTRDAAINRALNVFLLHGMELLQLAQNENKVTLAAVHQLITIVFQFISIITSLS